MLPQNKMITNRDTVQTHERVSGLPKGIKIKSYWPCAKQKGGIKNHCDLERGKKPGNNPNKHACPPGERERKREES